MGVEEYGRIIHWAQDRFGEIFVTEGQGRRCLLSGKGTLQSMIFTDRPSFPAMDYSQALAAALLFCSRPRKILLVGLGGGTLAKFFLEACAGADITAVEISGAVIAAASRYFDLPAGEARLQVVEADARDTVAQARKDGARFDLVLVDAFDEKGFAAALRQRSFFEDCRDLMAADGVFAVNLWDRPVDGFPGIFETLEEVFDKRVAKLRLGEDFCNVVVFGFKESGRFRNLARRRPAARQLGVEWNINFSRFLRNLAWQNEDRI